MTHTIAIRLPGELFKKVQKTSKLKGKNRSMIIREALEDFFARMNPALDNDPYQSLMTVIPSLEGSHFRDLATHSKKYLKEKFHARSRTR